MRVLNEKHFAEAGVRGSGFHPPRKASSVKDDMALVGVFSTPLFGNTIHRASDND
jgi:hypothetical protein